MADRNRRQLCYTVRVLTTVAFYNKNNTDNY